MDWLPYIVWSVASALLSGIAALALNRWLPRRGAWTRAIVATMIALAPIFILIGWAVLPTYGAVLLSLSADEFLIPVTIQVTMTLALAAPIAWLVSRRGGKNPNLADVFV
jgi:hypothetical protein